MGVTIAAVIHQPSYEIFQMFDDILLLAKGGRTAFYGPEGQVQGYFEKLGYALPHRTNPADVYMDIVAGIKSRIDGPPQTPQVTPLPQPQAQSLGVLVPSRSCAVAYGLRVLFPQMTLDAVVVSN